MNTGINAHANMMDENGNSYELETVPEYVQYKIENILFVSRNYSLLIGINYSAQTLVVYVELFTMKG